MYRLVYSDTLSHHGILGMKWGKRNGPPYPLDAGDHSASERKAGWRKSLVKSFAKSPSPKTQKNSNNVNAEVRNYQKTAEEVQKKISDIKSTADLSTLNSASDKFNALGNELGEDYENYYKKAINDKQFREAVLERLHEYFGDGVDDEEYFDMVKDEVVDDVLRERTPSSLKNKTQELYEAGDGYFNELLRLSKDILEEYENLPISKTGSNVDQSYLNGLLDDRSRWNSYMYRHFDDYWVNDVESRYDIFDSFTANEYNRRFAN